MGVNPSSPLKMLIIRDYHFLLGKGSVSEIPEVFSGKTLIPEPLFLPLLVTLKNLSLH